MMNDTADRPPAHSPAERARPEGPAPEHSPPDEVLRTLIVRAWKEGGTGTVRARLLDAATQPPATWATADGADAICAAVRAWLERPP